MAADRIYVTLGGTVGKVEGQVPLEIIQGAHGKSAYEIAVRNGFVGTEQEWIDSLGQPARDAAEAALQTMGELETEFNEKEAERENTFENNESQRQFTFENNEEARQRTFDKNESMMVSEEQTRQSNEQKRIADEELRRRFESNRNDAELAREQAEQKREKAETDRQRFFLANETNRQTTFESNEEHRNREELVRQQNEEQRVANENGRVTEEESRKDSENERRLSEEYRNETFDTLRTDSQNATKRANDAAEDVENNMEAVRQDLADAKQSAAESASHAENASRDAEAAVANSEEAQQTAADAVEIAKGANIATSYADYASMVTAFNTYAKDKFRVGQNIYIKVVGVPDLWVSEISDSSVPYTFTTDEAFVGSMSDTGKVQVGYYSFSMLETQKVDLNDYVKKSQTANATQAGLIRVGNGLGISINSNGVIFLDAATEALILAKANQFKAIVPQHLDYAVKVGITTNTIKLTDAEIAAAKQWLGIFEWEGSMEDYLALESIDPNITYHILES